MLKKTLIGSLGAAVISLAGVHAAYAGDLPPPSADPAMHGDMTIYGWYAIVGGDVGVNGFGPAEIPDSSGSILDVLDGFFMANASLRYGDWGIYGDLVWADLGQGNSSANGFLNAQSSLSALVGTAALTYTLIDTPDGHLDALAGARLWSVDVGLDLTGGLGVDVHEDGNLSWVDPLVGLRGRYMISPSVFIDGTGAVGGFGVGSKFMWDVAGSIGYNFNDNFSASIGYRALGADYSNNGDVVDITAHGPMMALTARF
jgi:hypothetical protein